MIDSLFYNICVLMFMFYTVCYFTGIFYALVRQISMLFLDIKDFVFYLFCWHMIDLFVLLTHDRSACFVGARSICLFCWHMVDLFVLLAHDRSVCFVGT